MLEEAIEEGRQKEHLQTHRETRSTKKRTLGFWPSQCSTDSPRSFTQTETEVMASANMRTPLLSLSFCGASQRSVLSQQESSDVKWNQSNGLCF